MLRRSLKQIKDQKIRRAKRVRAKVSGTAACPRVSVFRSLKHLTIQVIDDVSGKTLVMISDKVVKGKANVPGAKELGLALVAKLKDLKITKVVFDKGRYTYHGKIKAVAEGLREGGITV
ncbi:MAG: 50S ribosomal protein L18 [Candidatus Komeilibacteria bacterium]|nr:50S ribosomal protein L18 [Candidatus Komeilibacteria bacterium]